MFLLAWLAFIGFGILEAIRHEKGQVWFFFAIVISFLQMLTFALYRTDHRQRIIGWAIVVFFSTYLAYLVASVSVSMGNPSVLFALYYVSLASAVFHTVYGFIFKKERKKVQAV